MQLVAVARCFQPANKFFGTDWTARFWVRCSNLNVTAHVVLFFEDSEGVSHPSITPTDGPGTISSVGTAVTGIGTAFDTGPFDDTKVQVGDLILAADQVRRVVAIGSATTLTVDVAFNPNITNEEYIFQKYTILDPSLAPKAEGDAVVVEATVPDFGRFEALDVKLVLNEFQSGDVLDISEPFVINDIGKSLHLDDNTIARNKQREYKLYRMAVANPDVFTPVEAGLTGVNQRIEDEPVVLSGVTFARLDNVNLFPFSEVVERVGIKAKGTIQYSGQPVDQETITIGFQVYEFDNNASVGAGNIAVTIGGDAQETFQNFVDAVNTNSPLASASVNAEKNTVTIQALLAGPDGNTITFAADCLVVKLTPVIGTLDGGVEGATFTRGVDYIMRYTEGEIARTAHSSIPQPSPEDLAVTYSFFPGDVPLNQSYAQTIKPVGVKLEIDPTCLFFFRGRMHDFTDPSSININFAPVERSPSRFSYLKPGVRGKYTQVVHFSTSPPHDAPLDFAAMVDQEAILVKTSPNGTSIAIPQDNPDGWFFTDDGHIRLSTSSKYVRADESALFETTAEYEFVYFVKFQFTTAPIGIADVSSAYALLPYSYKSRQVEETKEDVQQVLFLDANRQAVLKLPAILDQSLAELSRSLAGQTEILPDDQWDFVDQSTVEVLLSAFDAAATYRLTYKSSKISYVTP